MVTVKDFPIEFEVTSKFQLISLEEDGLTYTVLISPRGNISFYYLDERHRENDKPAEIYANGDLVFYIHDQKHRLLGPAIVTSSDDGFWYYQGQYIEVTSQAEYEQWLKLKAFE